MAEKKSRADFLLDSPFDPKDLVRDLPELLAGPEPIIDNPVARRMLVSDPTCRAGIQAISQMLIAVRGGSEAVSSLRRTGVPRIPRSVEVARKHLKEELHRVLLRVVAADALARASVDSAVGVYVDHEIDHAGLVNFESYLARIHSKTVSGSAVDAAAIRIGFGRLRVPSTDDSKTDAALAIDAAESLIPGQPLARLDRYILQYQSTLQVTCDQWLKLAAQVSLGEIHRYAILWAAIAASNEGNYSRALDLDEILLEQYGPHWRACYNGCLHAAESNRPLLLKRFEEGLRSAIENSFDKMAVSRDLRNQFLRDAGTWRRQMSKERNVPATLWNAFAVAAPADSVEDST